MGGTTTATGHRDDSYQVAPRNCESISIVIDLIDGFNLVWIESKMTLQKLQKETLENFSAVSANLKCEKSSEPTKFILQLFSADIIVLLTLQLKA